MLYFSDILSQCVNNFRNTIPYVNRILGRALDDPELVAFEKPHMLYKTVEQDGRLAVEVQYGGESKILDSVQLAAMYLGHLKVLAQNDVKQPVTDCVISVPTYFTDQQRRALLEAAEIAGLKCLRLMNDITASALCYGLCKTDLPEDKPAHHVLVDMGHSGFTVAVFELMKGKLAIKSVAFDRNLGGRDFDEALVQHCAKLFLAKHKIDVRTNPKALFRARAACERLKKVLSANSEAALNIESLMNDIDVSTRMARAEFEDLIKPALERMEGPMQQALDEAGIKKETVDTVSIVGGSTRIPIVRERIANFYGRPISTSLNQEEAVARGCALQCAIISPAFKVRDFTANDVVPYAAKAVWDKDPADTDEPETLLFPKNSSIPSTKMLTLLRSKPFELSICYAVPSLLPDPRQMAIAKFVVKDFKTGPNGEPAKIKARLRMNQHGAFQLEGMQIVEEVEQAAENVPANGPADEKVDSKKEEPKKEDARAQDDSKMEVDAKDSDLKKAKKVVKKDIPFDSFIPASLPTKTIEQMTQLEVCCVWYLLDFLIFNIDLGRNVYER